MSQLLDQLRNEIRVRHYSIRTEQTYAHWVVRYVRHHNLRRPSEMGAKEVGEFLTHLASDLNGTYLRLRLGTASPSIGPQTRRFGGRSFAEPRPKHALSKRHSPQTSTSRPVRKTKR